MNVIFGVAYDALVALLGVGRRVHGCHESKLVTLWGRVGRKKEKEMREMVKK